METLTDTTRIVGLFKRLLERRALLSIKIEDHPQEFTTAVINVSPENGLLMLDELKPEQGHALLKLSPTFKARAQLEGVQIAFTATMIEIGEQDAIAYYTIQIPAQVDYHQRRQSVRIPLSAANPLPVTLTAEDGLSLKGNMADLSTGGLRIRFDRDLPTALEPGQKLDCSFPLPPDNKQRFTCEVIVRVIKGHHESYKAAFIGGQFADITKPQERQLARMVMLLQRVSQQKRNG
jgi:c-di-GMP-binding flagellar brake protein YcgR